MRKTPQSPPPTTAPASGPFATLTDEQRQFVLEMQQEFGIPPEEAEDMLAAALRGEGVSEYYGYTPEICNAIENVALADYRIGRYELALNIFAWLVDVTGGKRGSGWRGMAACYQATRRFEQAIHSYEQALLADPDDVFSDVFCGECLCHIGELSQGLHRLQKVLDNPRHAKSTEPHILRARAIVAAQGARPAVTAKNKSSAAQSKPAPELRRAQKAPSTAPDPGMEAAIAKEVVAHTHDEVMQQIMADPDLKMQLDRLTEAVRNRELTYKDIADFSDEQMDAGYAVACQFLDRGNAVKALETVGWLMWIDSRDGRFYQLAGICMHHLKLWCLADYLYMLALQYGAQQATTLIYQGEAKLMLDEKSEAKSLLTQGVKIAEGQATLHDIRVRGQFLLKQLSI